MITNVQVRNVQKSRSGLTRMAKLTFEDLTGSTPAMLWPEEFAKLGDLVKNDLIGFVKGTLDRRREPAELIISKIMPDRERPRPSSPAASSSGSTRDCTRKKTSSGCCGACASVPGTSTSTSRSAASSTSAGRSTRPGPRCASDTTTD